MLLLQALASDGDVAVRRMRDDPADHQLMSRWLSDERVLEYYRGRDRPLSYEASVATYGPRARGEHYVRACIIEQDGIPIGYIQYYTVQAAADEHPDGNYYEIEDASDAYAIDMFIGDPELWNRGIGSRALSAVTRHIFEELGARRIVIDPRVDNPRAVRAYEKSGFHKLKVLQRHELYEGKRVDAWLMMLERPKELRHDD